MDSLKDVFNNKSVAFVSQAAVLENKNFGLEIDSYDLVYRTNVHLDINTKDYGSRCDVISVSAAFTHLIPNTNVKTIISFAESDFPAIVCSKSYRDAITDYWKKHLGVNIKNPTAGLIAYHITQDFGAKSINMYGITGYQNKNKEVVNHSEEKHYNDDYVNKLNRRKRNLKANMRNYLHHDFAAINKIWSHLLDKQLVVFDKYSMEYFS